MEIPVASGDIIAGKTYNVVAGASQFVTYDGVQYFLNQFFVGVDGVTTFTVSDATCFVYEAGYFLGFTLELEPDIFTGKFPDEGYFKGLSVAGDVIYYFLNYTTEETVQNNSNFIPSESKIVVPYLIDAITDIVGNELYNGVTYDRLIELEAAHPEITLTIEATNNITQILINGVKILVDINH